MQRRAHGLAFGQRLAAHRIGADLLAQGWKQNAEHARGQRAVAAAALQRVADQLALHRIERLADKPRRDLAHGRRRQIRRELRGLWLVVS